MSMVRANLKIPAGEDPSKPAERLFEERKRALVAAFLENPADAGFPVQHAGLVDDYFQARFSGSVVGPRMDFVHNPYAIVALGGYGRREQCVHSDVDALFLFRRKVPETADELVQEMIYPLWDIGLDIGHAVRSIAECAQLAEMDIEVLMSLLYARFVCGSSAVYTELTGRVRKKILERRKDGIVRELIERTRERHDRYGDSAFLLEPNLKEGRGGLRDYHTMLWIAHVKHGFKFPRDLEYNGLLSHEEFARLAGAVEFISAVRNCLHYKVGRKYDQLHFAYQQELAGMMGFADPGGRQSVERFLGALHGRMEEVKQRCRLFLHETAASQKRFRAGRKPAHTPRSGGLTVQRNMLGFDSTEILLTRPRLLVDIFAESVRLKLPLSMEAGRLVGEFGHLLENGPATEPEVVKQFETILVSAPPGLEVLNDMHTFGLISRILPPFSAVTDRIEYDEYHVLPVDKHLLRTVRNLKSFDAARPFAEEPLCREIASELTRRRRIDLYWAALLHDIGKDTDTADHSARGARLAEELLEQKGLKPASIDTISFLIKHHKDLVVTATRRDIRDEETALTVARTIRDTERLKMLYLLTIADLSATGPKAYTEWTSALVREFFLKILKILEGKELATADAVKRIREKKRRVVSELETEAARREVEALFAVMSPRYLLYTPAAEIPGHIRLYNSLGLSLHPELENPEFAWTIASDPATETRTVTICAKDRPGLFAGIAGTFTLNGVNILDARIFTWKNGIAVNRFRVTPPPDPLFEPERWHKAERDLHAVLKGKLDLDRAIGEKIEQMKITPPKAGIIPDRVEVNNDTSSFYTLVEIYTHDSPGLLYRLTGALYKLKLDIWSARIATTGDQVVDVFYVRDLDGQKVDQPEQVAALKTALIMVLSNQPFSPAQTAGPDS